MTDRQPDAPTDEHTAGLLRLIDASPTPFHAVSSAVDLLAAEGFVQVDERVAWPTAPGRYYLVRGGSLVAWVASPDLPPSAPWRIVGAHTDSPNLRVKPRPDRLVAGWQQLAVEPYGGLLRNSWLDRDLGLAGRVVVRTPTGPAPRLFLDRRPLARVAQLAVHLDRNVNDDGLVLNPQQHLVPLWGVGTEVASFAAYAGEQVGVDSGDVLAWDAMFFDVQPATRLVRRLELVAASRLDNLASTYAAVRALLAVADRSTGWSGETAYRPMIVLFDHEEVGSASERGAGSPLLPAVLERVVLAAGGTREDYWQGLAGSLLASADMAHATHPNYPERHEPGHLVAMNGGPVLKVNVNLRYATDAVGAAAMRLACERAGVPLQSFVVRSDLPCGSTIGPISAERTGLATVDVGAPLLSMHSIRELAGVADQAMYAAALTAFLAPA